MGSKLKYTVIPLEIKILPSPTYPSDHLRHRALIRPVSRFTTLLTMISTDKIISVPAPQEEQYSEEDISQSEMEPPFKSARSGSGGKKACDWKLHVQIQSVNQSDLIDQVKDELQSLIPTDIFIQSLIFLFGLQL